MPEPPSCWQGLGRRPKEPSARARITCDLIRRVRATGCLLGGGPSITPPLGRCASASFTRSALCLWRKKCAKISNPGPNPGYPSVRSALLSMNPELGALTIPTKDDKVKCATASRESACPVCSTHACRSVAQVLSAFDKPRMTLLRMHAPLAPGVGALESAGS